MDLIETTTAAVLLHIKNAHFLLAKLTLTNLTSWIFLLPFDISNLIASLLGR